MRLSDVVLPGLHRAGAADRPKTGNLQFDFAEMSESERAALRYRLAALRFRLDINRVRSAALEVLRGKQAILEMRLRPAQEPGVRVHAILYEDLCNNRTALLHSICPVIGVDPPPIQGVETWYRQVFANSLSLQVENWDELNAVRELRDIVAAWRALIADRDSYLGPVRRKVE